MARASSLPWLLIALLHTACEDVEVAKDPVWNKQPCEHCHMVLSDPRYAAQASTKEGRRLYFDDVGCMASFLNGRKIEPVRAWIRMGAHWHDARTTRYARDGRTPMGFGFVPREHGPFDLTTLRQAIAQEQPQRANHERSHTSP
jgi:hypothetical protein